MKICVLTFPLGCSTKALLEFQYTEIYTTSCLKCVVLDIVLEHINRYTSSNVLMVWNIVNFQYQLCLCAIEHANSYKYIGGSIQLDTRQSQNLICLTNLFGWKQGIHTVGVPLRRDRLIMFARFITRCIKLRRGLLIVSRWHLRSRNPTINGLATLCAACLLNRSRKTSRND